MGNKISSVMPREELDVMVSEFFHAETHSMDDEMRPLKEGETYADFFELELTQAKKMASFMVLKHGPGALHFFSFWDLQKNSSVMRCTLTVHKWIA